MFRKPEAFEELAFVMGQQLAREGLAGLELAPRGNAGLEQGDVFLIEAKHSYEDAKVGKCFGWRKLLKSWELGSCWGVAVTLELDANKFDGGRKKLAFLEFDGDAMMKENI